MDLNDIRRDLEVVSVTGHTLSLEEQTVIKASLRILADNYKLDEIKFWGKVLGTSQDYVIAVGYKNDLVDNKVLFASSDVMSGVSGWFQLDTIDDTTKATCSQIRGRFSGVKTKEYIVGGEGGESEGEAQTVNESVRLAYVVNSIDHDTHVIPKGALMQQPQGRVYNNHTFEGLRYEDAKQKGFYVHRRRPCHVNYTQLASDTSMDKAFLDTLETDQPQHWILREKDAIVTLRNIAWPGSVAYHLPCSKTFGFSYFGSGEANTDLGFVL